MTIPYTDCNVLTLDLIRHGEPEGGPRYRGSLDDPLSEAGWQQLRQSTQTALNANTTWDGIISSPMKRCYAFADQLSETLNIPCETNADLKELCFGDLEGMTPQQAWDQYPALLTNIWKDPEAYTTPNGEPFHDFSLRVEKALKHIIETHNKGHFLLVVHGGVIRAALNRLFSIPASTTFQIEVPYASVSRFKIVEHDKTKNYSIEFINGFKG